MQLLYRCAALAAIVTTRAVTYTYSSPEYSFAEGLVPDQFLNSFSLNVVSPITSITDVNVHLRIEGGFNGDLLSLLLLGIDETSPFATLLEGITGATSGVDIWLDDEAAENVHDAGGTGVLTGTFKPNGPEALSLFYGLDPNGASWNLLVADNAAGLESVVIQWELQITGEIPATSVPEPIGYTGPIALAGIIAAGRCFSQRHWRG